MLEEQVIKYDKLIGEFMGGTLDSPLSKSYYFKDKGKYEPELLYHSSLDCLMPVLKKIEQLGCIVEITYSLIDTCRIYILGDKKDKVITIEHTNNEDPNNNINFIFESVVEYIEWYNKNKK